MPRLTSKDCLKCGLCCCSLEDTDRFANVSLEDKERLGKKLTKRLVRGPETMEYMTYYMGMRSFPEDAIKTKRRRQKEGPLKGQTLCQCACLEGTVLQEVRCTIYDVRPEVCRKAVKPGDPTCRKLRKLHEKS